jgi:hypothetical protein
MDTSEETVSLADVLHGAPLGSIALLGVVKHEQPASKTKLTPAATNPRTFLQKNFDII